MRSDGMMTKLLTGLVELRAEQIKYKDVSFNVNVKFSLDKDLYDRKDAVLPPVLLGEAEVGPVAERVKAFEYYEKQKAWQAELMLETGQTWVFGKIGPNYEP